MTILNATGLFCINEGGRYFTLTFQPWCWLRVYLLGRVYDWGDYSVSNAAMHQCRRFSRLLARIDSEIADRAIKQQIRQDVERWFNPAKKTVGLVMVFLALSGCSGEIEGSQIENARKITECVNKKGIPIDDGYYNGAFGWCAYPEARK